MKTAAENAMNPEFLTSPAELNGLLSSQKFVC